MKKLIAILLVLLSLSFVGCSKPKGYTIAIPSDPTNEARALMLLEAQGYIKLKENVSITATVLDVVENPYNLKFNEVEAAQIPNILRDVDFGVINTNYAISAGLNPASDALAKEGSASAYANILAVKRGNENKPIILALKAALESKKVAEFITNKYGGSVVSTVDNPTDGYDASINYEELKGQSVSVAASPTPHCEILEIVKEILAAKGITLEIKEFDDYVVPNTVVNDGQIDANYFQHQPYLDDFNLNNKTDIVSVACIHVEPLGIYGGKQTSLDVIKK